MDEQARAVARMRVITVSREYGSGGGEIASRLARRLSWELIDHEVVVRTAGALGVPVTAVVEHDEQVEGWVGQILRNMQRIESGGLAFETRDEVTTRRYHAAFCHVVEGAVGARPVVIVGRGGQVLLAGRRDVLHVRVVAPLEQRIAYVMGREGVDRVTARARIWLKERARARYLQAIYRRRPDDPYLYDLVVNTGQLTLDTAVDVVYQALERKGSQLAMPARQLGPADGLGRYPGRASDFLPPMERFAP